MALALPTALRPAVPQGSRPGRGRLSPAVWMHTAALSALAGLWSILAWGNQAWEIINPVLLPTPLEVVRAGYELYQVGLLQQHLVVSLLRIVQGFGLAAVATLTLATLTGLSKLTRILIEPLVEFLRPIPPLAFLPMFLVWCGLGEASKVAFIAYTTFFPMFVTMAAGVMQADIVLLRAAASLGATRWQLLCRVVLPAALSGIIMGLRLGFSLAIFVIVGAEFMGADSGLGYLIMEGRTFFQPAQIMVGALMLGGLGFLANVLLLYIERRLLRWREV